MPTTDPLPVISLTVASVTDEAADVVVLELVAPNGAALPDWRPGAHIDVLLPEGVERQYSLCGDPAERDRWRIAVLLEPDGRGGSRHIHREVRAGDTLRCRGPRNAFALQDAPAYGFVAGGIGITPILPMVREVAAAGRPWKLLYGGRRRSSMAFATELEPHGDAVVLSPEDTHGLLDLEGFLGGLPAGAAVYACGPEPLLAALEQRCADRGETTLHVERFRASEEAVREGDAPFVVELASTGVSYPVGADETIADALEAAGVEILTSCREGTCGTCETAVLEGIPDHRDDVLTTAEQEAGDVIMICCSRAAGERLVLDL